MYGYWPAHSRGKISSQKYVPIYLLPSSLQLIFRMEKEAPQYLRKVGIPIRVVIVNLRGPLIHFGIWTGSSQSLATTRIYRVICRANLNALLINPVFRWFQSRKVAKSGQRPIENKTFLNVFVCIPWRLTRKSSIEKEIPFLAHPSFHFEFSSL